MNLVAPFVFSHFSDSIFFDIYFLRLFMFTLFTININANMKSVQLSLVFVSLRLFVFHLGNARLKISSEPKVT